MDEKLSRRTVLQTSAALGALAVFGSGACSRQQAPLVCTDTSGLSPTDSLDPHGARLCRQLGRTWQDVLQLPAIHTEHGQPHVRHLQGRQGTHQSKRELQVIPCQAGLMWKPPPRLLPRAERRRVLRLIDSIFPRRPGA